MIFRKKAKFVATATCLKSELALTSQTSSDGGLEIAFDRDGRMEGYVQAMLVSGINQLRGSSSAFPNRGFTLTLYLLSRQYSDVSSVQTALRGEIQLARSPGGTI